jgi:hypothetical protein
MDSVTLETKCWEGDWRIVLDGPRLRALADGNAYPFAERVLLVNNVRDREAVCRAADAAVRNGWITRYAVVEDHAREAMSHAGVDPASFGAGYAYSISELVGIHLCRTEYLLHYSSDSMPDGRVDWVAAAIRQMQSDPRIKVANLAWNRLYEQARAESSAENDDFWIGQGFSDQCYLVRAADFRAPIYGHTHPDSHRYPAYGGELFEKRVDAWMRSCGWLRATYKHGSYLHRNHPRPLGRRIAAHWERVLAAAGRLAGGSRR